MAHQLRCLPLCLLLIVCTPARAQDDVERASYQAHVAAAEKSLQLGDTLELRRWLDAAPAGRRGWEWRYLDAIADTSARTLHTPDTPSRIAVSPAGDLVATVEGSVVRLWSYPSLEPAGEIDGHTDAVYRAEFDASGARLVTVSRDLTSRTWEVGSGAEIARIELSNPAFAAATFSPDGATAATCAWERDDEGVHGVVWIWDAATGELRSRSRVGIKPLSAIRFTPDGGRILTGSWDGLVHVLDADGVELHRIALPDHQIYNAVNDIAISPDGTLVAAATKDRTTSVFRIDCGELVATLAGHGGYVESVAFSADGSILATASGDATGRLWRTSDWAPDAVLRGHLNTVRGLALLGDGVLTCSLDGTVREWDPRDAGRTQIEIPTGAEGCYSGTLSPDGTTISVACFDGSLRQFDAATGRLVASWEAHPGSTCHAASYSADGSRLITCSWDKTARVWREPSHEPIAVLDVGDGVYFATISGGGNRAATCGSELLLWDVDAERVEHRIGVSGASPRRAAFSPDGSLVVTGWTDGRARVHEVATGAEVAVLQGEGPTVESVAFTPGGRSVVIGDTSGAVHCFATLDWGPTWACDTGDRAVNHLAISGDRVAVGTDLIGLIDLETGRLVLERRVLADTVWHVSWSADGTRLGLCTTAGTACVLTAPGKAGDQSEGAEAASSR